MTFNIPRIDRTVLSAILKCPSQNLTCLPRYPSKAAEETAGGRLSDDTTPQKISHFKVFWVKTICVPQVACFLPWLKRIKIFESLWFRNAYLYTVQFHSCSHATHQKTVHGSAIARDGRKKGEQRLTLFEGISGSQECYWWYIGGIWKSGQINRIKMYISDFAHIPWEDTPNFPKPPQTKKFPHKLLVKRPGYLPGVCGWDLTV